jgi:predicted pyridoxine 5'-phosphate oxidase superfamily flavin-nucleotide-binding protein
MAEPATPVTARIAGGVRDSVLCWLATADADGRPNVSPKELFATRGDEWLAIADIASPVSVANVRVNPAVSVAFVDVFRQRGWKLTGTAELIEPDDARFAEWGRELLEMAGPDFRIRRIIAVRIEAAAEVIAPSYRIFPDRTVAEQIARAHDRYGVRPA